MAGLGAHLRSLRSSARRIGALVALGATLTLVVAGSAPASATLVNNGSPVVAQNEIAAIDVVQLRSPLGRPVIPVQVTVTSSRAIEATLRLSVQGSSAGIEVPYALAANSVVTQVFAVPVRSIRPPNIDAELISNGDVLAEAESDGDRDQAPANAVGLLGVEGQGEVALVPSIGRGSLIALDDFRLLPALDTVVVSSPALQSLSDPERGQLLRWTGVGGQLIVVDEPGAIDALLPAAWVDDGFLSFADAGVIRYVGPDWMDEGIPPGAHVSVDSNSLAFVDTENSALLNDAGFQFPGLGVIAAVLLVYLLVAGPVTFGVLAKIGRPTLAWGVIPALAAVFTVGVLVIGAIVTSGRGAGHASIVEFTSAGPYVTETFVLAESGTQRIEIPEGWALLSGNLNFGDGQRGAPLTVRPDRLGSELVYEIDAGSAASSILTGPGVGDGSMQITIEEVTEERIVANVRNDSGSNLVDVVAMVGGQLVDLDDLDDGAEQQFELRLGGFVNAPVPELREWGVEDDFFEFGGGGRGFRDGPVNGSSWVAHRSIRFGSGAPYGLVTVVGWTRDAGAAIGNGDGRTAHVVRTPVGAAAAGGPGIRHFVSSRPEQDVGFGPAIGARDLDGGLVAQYVRTPGASPDVGIEVHANVAQARLWIDGEWRSLDLGEPGRLVVRIPDEAWTDNVMWVDFQLGGFFGEPGQLDHRLVEAGVTAIDAELLPPGEESIRPTQFGGAMEEPPFFEDEAVLGAVEQVEPVIGETVEFGGILEQSFDIWEVELAAGQRVVASMLAVDRFNGSLDPELIVRDPQGFEVARNDDFRACCDSRVQFTAEVDGVYEFETRQLGGMGAFGEYVFELEVEEPS